MPNKNKGTNAERDLIHKFWKVGWAAIRVAGSGSSRYPSPDLLAGNNLRKMAIECKSSKSPSIYLTKKEVAELIQFARLFGAEPWIAARFDKTEWMFLSIEECKETELSYVVEKENAKKRGLLFEEVISSSLSAHAQS
jgi:holliday junction resolvase Hjr